VKKELKNPKKNIQEKLHNKRLCSMRCQVSLANYQSILKFVLQNFANNVEFFIHIINIILLFQRIFLFL
jgi:hypothetical protein